MGSIQWYNRYSSPGPPWHEGYTHALKVSTPKPGYFSSLPCKPRADAEKLSVRNNYQIMDWWLCLLMKKRCLTDGGRDLVRQKSYPAATIITFTGKIDYRQTLYCHLLSLFEMKEVS